MAKITRKELKSDKFAAEVSKTYEFVQQQRGKLIRVGIVAAVVVIAGLGTYFLTQYRRSRANEDLAHAMRVFHGLTKQEASQFEEGMAFLDDKAKYTQAEKEFATVADKYSWLRQGRLARYYLGLSKQHLGKTEEAIRELRAVAENRDPQASALARFALAEIYARTGKLAEAEKIYRELAQRPSDTVPKDSALLALADQISETKPAEAEKIYLELKKQGPNHYAAETAEKRLAELKKK